MNLRSLPSFLRDLFRNMLQDLSARQIVRERNMKRRETLQKAVKTITTQISEKAAQKKDIIRPIRRIRLRTTRN